MEKLFRDYQFKGQLYKELKEEIMDKYELSEEDKVPEIIQNFFDSMIEVESRHI